MTEIEFKDLYTAEYKKFIKSFFPRIEKTAREFPEYLNRQVDECESAIINHADDIVLKTVIDHNIDLFDIFGSGYDKSFLLNKLVLKCWSIQKPIREDTFDPFISQFFDETEDPFLKDPQE